MHDMTQPEKPTEEIIEFLSHPKLAIVGPTKELCDLFLEDVNSRPSLVDWLEKQYRSGQNSVIQ